MKISIYLAIGLAAAVAVLGMAFGYYFGPEYQVSMYEKNAMDLGPADRSLDLRYINAMIAHHRGAVLLAEQLAENSEREEMQKLAQDISTNEPKLIAELYAWKKDWYGDTKSVRDPLVARLGPADAKSDLRFLNAMIAHHKDGIIMTKETRLKSSRAEILDNADAVEAFLSASLADLEALRAEWFEL